MSPYYPGLGGNSQASLAQYDIGDPSYVCSPQSTIIAVLMVIGGLFVGLIAGFVFFYRMKRKHWSKVILHGIVKNHQSQNKCLSLENVCCLNKKYEGERV